VHMTGTGQRSSSEAGSSGAYGIRFRGLEGATELLVPVDGRAPAYLVESAVRSPPPGPEHVDDGHAELRLRSGGRVLIDRRGGSVRFEVPHALRSDELVHPYLAPAAGIIGRWLGRESVHAGAVAVDNRALGVVGTREAGKSSTLAWLALAGTEVVCDDPLVIDGRSTFTGPRSIDLREDAAARLGAGEAIGVTGARERWRLRLGSAGDRHVLAGFVFLTWGDDGALPAAQHALVLAAHAWSHQPLGRLGNLIDVAVTLQRADKFEVDTLARRWGCRRMWRTTRAAIGAVLGGSGRSAAVALWARHLRGVREPTVFEWHVMSALAPVWGLPSTRVPAAVVSQVRAAAGPEAGEPWPSKLRRAGLALRNARTARSKHILALHARGLTTTMEGTKAG
jgi:hypothetical protein